MIKRIITRFGLALGVAALIAVSDQLTKLLVVMKLRPFVDNPVLGNFFKLTLVYNPNTVFGLSFGKGFPYHLLVIGIMIMVLVALAFEKHLRNAAAYGLILGGAIGNLIDRFTRPGVVDFLNFGVGDLRWPYFNLADSAVVVGVCLLLFFSFWHERKKPQQAGAQEEMP